LLKALGSIFYTGREIVPNELLDIGSLGSNEEELFFGTHRILSPGADALCKLIENSITIAVLDQCIPDLGINRKIARRIRKSGVVLEPDRHFAEVPIENVLSIVLKFIVSWVPIEFSLLDTR
jgi:hypothetical protein